MFFKKIEVDERIKLENEKNIAKVYNLFIGMQIISIIIKLFIVGPIYSYYILDIITLAFTIIMTLIFFIKYKLIGTGIDEAITNLRCRGKYLGVMVGCLCLIFGEVLFFKLIAYKFTEIDIISLSLYMITWLIPSLIVTILGYRKGVYTFGSKKNENKYIKRIPIIGVVTFLINLAINLFLEEKDLNKKIISKDIFQALFFSFFFIVSMYYLIKFGEKRSDKELDNGKK